MAEFNNINLAQIYGAVDEANARKQQIAMQQQQLQRQGIQDQRADQEYGRQQQLRDIYAGAVKPDGTLDENAIFQKSLAVDPASALAFKQSQQKQRAETAKMDMEAKKAEIENLSAKSKYGRDLLASVTPNDYPSAIQHLKESGFAFANSAPEQYDPQWVQSHVNDATTFISQLEKSKDRDMTMRGQDISMRGQDIGRDTAIRGQNLSASTARRGQDISASNASQRLAFDKTGGVAGVAPAGKPVKLTEDQGKATGWLSQANNAYANMKSVMLNADNSLNTDVIKPGALEAGVSSLGFDSAANGLRSENRQKFVQATESMSEALLRAATGAGVNKEEAAQKIRELTPTYLDKPAVTQQKLNAIPVYLESLKVRSGGGYNLLDNNQQPAGITQAGLVKPKTSAIVPIKSDADYNKLPKGTRFKAPDGSIRIKQ
ncbi:MAG: hypothetical protein V4440_14535 [Pseudomonadota bacterium]